MLAHRLLGGCSSSLSVPCQSLGSALIAAACTHLGAPLSSALNPLSSRTRKQRGKKKSLASLAAPDLFPDSLPASRGALAPFRLRSRHQHQSSPCNQTEARASAPSPRLPWRVSRQASRAGECWSAPIGAIPAPICGNLSALPSAPLLLRSPPWLRSFPPPPPAVSTCEGVS